MHLSVRQSHSIEEAGAPVNPDQQPADMLLLSFTDSDLACMARAQAGEPAGASLLLTSLGPMTHPLSVDLYIEQVAVRAKVVVARVVGGHEWWRYGAQELGRVARENGIALILVPGDNREDARLTELSTVPAPLVRAVDACLDQGGAENARRVLRVMRALAAGEMPALPVALPTPPGALYAQVRAQDAQACAAILFYRAHMLAADTAPVDALLTALAARGMNARAFMVTSLKDPQALAALAAEMRAHAPDIVLDATAFSAGSEAHPLAWVGVPVLQVAQSNMQKEAWEASARGLSTTDLAMHVVLPEADGRVFTRAISFKAERERDAATQWRHSTHQPVLGRVEYVADLARAWVALAKKPPAARRVALVLSDYPGRAGRGAYAVGLDGPASAAAIARLLREAEYTVGELPEGGALLAALRETQAYPLEAYLARFSALPQAQRQALTALWGAPQEDAFFGGGAFRLPCLRAGNLTVALQPDRGSGLDRKSGYHDATMPPRHGYLAFYWWLRETGVDALVHLGTHGNLEWLPGKSVALSGACWPEIALGAVPVVYPYIVSDPGEAAQAKRRIAAVTLSHLTPPLMPVALSPELAALEALVDEYSGADGLDGRRMQLLRTEILHRARRCGLPGADADEASLMAALETHLCDIKEQRVGDGLHLFGQAPGNAQLANMAQALHEISGGGAEPGAIAERLADAAANEARALLAALSGRFIPPGPGGSPVRGRLDILPTGRNMASLDPRMIPTPTAAVLGGRAAEEFVRRYVQDHGDWPQRVVIDVWGSATLRSGGDEIAQALCLMGAHPTWDGASHRVSGFEIIPEAELLWPRVDVSLRISGLFRDMFANLITLFDDAARAVAKEAGWPQGWRVFGSAPGVYGAGVSPLLDGGCWEAKAELGQAYLDASQFAYGRHAEGAAAPQALRERIAQADALIHLQDQRETDVLSGADFADAEGGFAAAAAVLGAEPALYHVDTSQPGAIKARTLAEEISLTLHARALNARWIEGQMRHGYAGAAAFAEAVDQLFAFAATTHAVAHAQFDAVFDAYVHDDMVRAFMARENPAALEAMLGKLAEAARRGLWNPLRNSVWPLLEGGAQGAAA